MRFWSAIPLMSQDNGKVYRVAIKLRRVRELLMKQLVALQNNNMALENQVHSNTLEIEGLRKKIAEYHELIRKNMDNYPVETNPDISYFFLRANLKELL